MLALLLLAAIFWRERTWFLDVAFQTFLMIKDGTVQVQVYRFGSAIVQLLPLAGIKLGLPLSWISFLYSISFPLVYLVFWWLIVKVFRQALMGVALALLYVAMTYDGFYWCTSELQQGLGFLLVIWAMILRFPDLKKGWHWVFIVFSLIALAFYHPLTFIPFFFCWAYFGLENKALRHPRYLYLAVILVLILWAKSHWAANWYDNAKMVTFDKNMQAFFPNYFSFPAYTKFAKNSLLYWWGLPVLGLSVGGYLLSIRKYFLVFMIVGASVGFIVLNAIGSPEAVYRFYSEVNYYPLVIFVGIPFCYTLLKDWGDKQWVWLILSVFIGLRLLLIGFHHQPYTDRIEYLAQLTNEAHQQYGGQRFITAEQNVAMDTLIMTWATPFESMLITANEHPDSVVTFLIHPTPDRFTEEMRKDASLLLQDFNHFKMKALQERGYFKFNNGNYIELDGQHLQSK